MFQLLCRRVMQVVVMLVALVSISSVCQAEKVVMDDLAYNDTLDTEYRLMIEAWDGNGLITFEVYNAYVYVGSNNPDGYYTIYYWEADEIYDLGVGVTVSQVWIESRVYPSEDWYSQGTPDYTVAP